MGTRDPRVDAYIAQSADFAKPILTYLREAVHSACPEVEETIKWRFPHFMYAGMLCGMGSFRQHCTFGFWKGRLIARRSSANGEDAMGQFGRITTVQDLPSKKVLAGYVKQAMKINETPVKAPPKARPKVRKPLVVPPDLRAALGKNRKAATTFETLSPSHRREYVEWITEAKRDETRVRRLATTIEWLAEGKSRNWKYAASSTRRAALR